MLVMSRRNLVVLFILLIGCSSDLQPTDEDSTRARETVTTAVAAWQNETARDLIRIVPPIRFVDDDWVAGWKLIQYDIASPDDPIGPFDDVVVNLTLVKGEGQVVERRVAYQVSLRPALAVLRSEP